MKRFTSEVAKGPSFSPAISNLSGTSQLSTTAVMSATGPKMSHHSRRLKLAEGQRINDKNQDLMWGKDC